VLEGLALRHGACRAACAMRVAQRCVGLMA